MPKINITYTPGKPAVIKVTGVSGNSCRDLSAPYANALGGRTLDDKPTAEMDQVPSARTGIQATLGG